MNEQAMRFRVGVFVLVMLVLLGVLVLQFGALPERIKPHIPYTVVLRDATGIAAGTPVRRSGVRIGTVRDVRLDNDTGLVHVEIAVDRNYPLHENDQARVVRGLLGGDVAIDFIQPTTPGEEPAEASEEEQQPPPGGAAAKPGTVFRAADQPAMDRFFSQAASLVPDAREALQEFRQTLRRVARLLPRAESSFQEVRELAKEARGTLPEFRRTNADVQAAARQWGQAGERFNNFLQANQDKAGKALDHVSDVAGRAARFLSDENQQNLAEALKNLRAGTGGLEGLAKNADASLKEMRQILVRLNAVTGLADETFTNLSRASKPWAERSDGITKNLEDASAQLNLLFRDARELFRAVGGGEGTLKALLTDPSLYQNLNDAACMVVRMMPRVDRALRDLELFADKIARHPESIGLGGVFIPGSGLKR